MPSSEWEIPSDLQPDPTEHEFDLDQVLRSVVAVKAMVPADAFTSQTLGTERLGSGVVIRPDGLIATIGYMVTEAEEIWLTTHDGRVIPGHALAYDFETGIGLIQALGKLALPALPIETGDLPQPGDTCVFASAGGRKHALRCTIAARQEFAGYWEYLLDDAIFTAPAHPSWGGAGLIGGDGKLMGIGSLVMQQQDGKGRRVDLNMVVPASLLPPILPDLLSYGRPNKPGAALARPLRDRGRDRRPGQLHGPQRAGAEGRDAGGRPDRLGRRHQGRRPARALARGLGLRHGGRRCGCRSPAIPRRGR